MLDPKNCQPGHEQYEQFTAFGKRRIQYDYRATDGVLFSTVADSLESARNRRAIWQSRRADKYAREMLR
ncbi:MAG: DUF3873 family protein [Parcubacteria group bacterium]